ncbi:MAG: cupin domain-containing protein [Pseudomonadota bacterium]
MQVTRIGDAKPYEAPKHFDMLGLRLQGFDASGSENFWIGFSNFLPGGGAESDASPIEKVYVVIEGEVTVETDDGDTTLTKYDSCWLPAGERRAIVNRTNLPALMLVVMPYPPGERP